MSRLVVPAGPSALPGDTVGLGIFDQRDRAEAEAYRIAVR